ncbi:hypothetical protein EJ03DRAFT_322881 [Teratosphaeria nubilosa]|uniref:Carboxymuconolactone decarboxylase-like domain-containing protein n=1 Tax=Teratosphaeria nubilosa TaxID=161662 RepID=A0A6G1LN97_9PEZI|nr:hypothetical protein EJ03DRAFT_322881 [Teratosphaeria nubilosa]
MRLPYIPDDQHMPNPADQAIVARIKERRGGQLLELDKTLLHAPPVADGWNAFLRSIRTQTTLPDSVRELAICRVAVLNGAWYEWEHHVPLLRASGALSEEVVEKVKMQGWSGEGLDERHRVVVEYTDAMTRGVVVGEEVFGRLRACFGEREAVEVTATVAAYNCVSRFLVALDVGEMAGRV